MGSLGLAIHFGWSRGCTNLSVECSISWVDDWTKSSLRERLGLHQTELRSEEDQSEYALEGWKMALVCLYSPLTSGNRKMRTQNAASVEVMKWVGSMMREWSYGILLVVSR